MDKFSELKAAAMAATPGPWGINRTGNTIVSNHSHPVATVSDAFHRQLAGGGVGKDAEFIAAANPAAVLELLAELEAKDKRIAELEGQLQSGFTPEALAQEERAENAEQRVAELEAKLATPVRLPALLHPESDAVNGMIFANGRNDAIAECSVAIRQAGFLSEASPMTVAGDE
ncbi:ead/Ea22-like family protein [Serratia ureilytica]|uniref:ead/Ea22-like family protein n=1 Tax=Serratia ureilytica TaxID=300181 RepID=UPI003F822E23